MSKLYGTYASCTCLGYSENEQTKNLLPLPDSCHKTIFHECGLDEGTVNAYKFDFSQGFGYRVLFGDMMHAYVTCYPNIDCTITTMSKSSIKPSQSHYKLLLKVKEVF